MTNDEGSSNAQMTKPCFVIPSSFVIWAFSIFLHLPVFNEVGRNFLQKTRWPLEHVTVTAGQAHLRISKVKLVAGARDGHIEQTPLFLQRIARTEGATAREHPVSQPDHEHG